MSYIITSIDGNITVAPAAADTTSTSLTLVGKEYSGWGSAFDQNFVNIMQNFAGPTAPLHPRTGQLFWDTSVSQLKIYSGSSFATVKAAGLNSARNIAVSGAVSGSANFDGTANINISTTLETKLSGSTGTRINEPNVLYSSPAITVDAYGRIIGITNTGGDGAGPPTYVSTFNGLSGAVTLTSAMITGALGYTPTNGGITSINSSMVSSALGYTPANDALVVHKTGDTMAGALNFNGNRIYNLPAPASSTDPARKAEVDALSAAKTTRVFNGGTSTSYNVTVSTSAPSGGNDGDIWYRY